MASINMTFTDTTPEENRAATYELDRINTIRAAHGEAEFSGVKDMIEYNILNTMLPEWIERQANAERQEKNIRRLWRDATTSERNAAFLALGGSGV